MLNCGKLIGQLSKITRYTHINQQYLPLKHVGFISISSSRCSSNTNDNKPSKPSGTTLKVEECVPGSQYSSAKKTLPPCEIRVSGDCPADCYEACGVPPPGGDQSAPKGSGSDQDCKKPIVLRYWKQLLAALILAGATLYMVTSNSGLKVDNKISSKESIKKKDKVKKGLRETTKIPLSSSAIPQEVPYLLIGAGTAAFSAFRSIKSRDPKAKVLVVTEEEDLPYMRPPLSKELWYNDNREATAQLNFRQWNGTQRSLFYEPPEFYTNVENLMQSEKGGVAIARGWKVKSIDVVNKTAILEDDYKIKYNKCLIATGVSPKNLSMFETANDTVKDKVIPFRTKKDFLELEENVNDPRVHDIVIIGGGFLGSELACSLARNLNSDTKKVYQIYKEKFIMAQVLPEYLSEWATKKVIQEGVYCMPSVEVKDFEMKNKQLTLILTNGQTVNADQVIVAIGARGNTDLATVSELEVDPEIGGFLVNAELEARSDLWIAGDVACFYDVRLGRRRVEHHDHAVVSGRLAGENMTGANKPYLHQSMFWSDLGPEIGYEAIGIVDSSLPTVGVFAKATENDTPLAAVSASNEVTRSASEEKASLEKPQGMIKAELLAQKEQEPIKESETKKTCPEEETKKTPLHEKQNDFGKGIIFYLKDDVVVGIVLWNIFNRMSIARQVLLRKTHYDELNEVAKLFTIHED